MDILIKNIGNLSKECNECLRTYIAMNDGDENLIGSLRVDCKAGPVDCPLVEVVRVYQSTNPDAELYMVEKREAQKETQ